MTTDDRDMLDDVFAKTAALLSPPPVLIVCFDSLPSPALPNGVGG